MKNWYESLPWRAWVGEDESPEIVFRTLVPAVFVSGVPGSVGDAIFSFVSNGVPNAGSEVVVSSVYTARYADEAGSFRKSVESFPFVISEAFEKLLSEVKLTVA